MAPVHEQKMKRSRQSFLVDSSICLLKQNGCLLFMAPHQLFCFIGRRDLRRFPGIACVVVRRYAMSRNQGGMLLGAR